MNYLEEVNNWIEPVNEGDNVDNAYTKLYKFAEAFDKDMVIGRTADDQSVFISIKSGNEFIDFQFSGDIYREAIDGKKFKVFKNGQELK
jgi:hypothetical protein